MRLSRFVSAAPTIAEDQPGAEPLAALACGARVATSCLVAAVLGVIGGAPAYAQPAAPLPQRITLEDALARVQARAPSVQAARARERASMLATTRVPLAPNPLVEIRGENLGPGPERLPRDIYATVTQTVELGGKRGARSTDAHAMAGEAVAERQVVEWQAAQEIVTAYVEAVRARDAHEHVRAQQQSIGDVVSLLAARVREGANPEADLLRFEAELTRLGSQVTRLSIESQTTLLTLGSRLGVAVRADQLVRPQAMTRLLDPARLTVEAVEGRADLQLAAARLARAESSATVERARGVPDLLVSGGYKRTSGFNTAVASIAVPLPLFDRNGDAVARAIGELGAARLQLQQVRELAFADAQARWTAAGELMARAARVDADLVTPAAAVRTAARAAFTEGRADLLQLVDAERLFGDASREALDLQLDALLASIRARLAIGESPLP